MYRHFYNLTSMPFELSPDPKFLWLGEKHKEGLSAVRYGILANAGFLSLTGDVGTGKTTLVNALANSLGDNIIFAKIPDPSLKILDFFHFAASAFKMNKKFSTKGEFLRHLEDFLFTAHAANKKVLLIIEEAQRLNHALLEEVRLLSNIEKQNAKLISILFVGQNEFNDRLKKNRALKQRVNISYNIQPLTEIETKAYIGHRLKIAGSETGIFSQGAIHEVYAFSKGNPRLINVVCDLALLSGYLKETKIIESQIIKDCAAEYEISDQTEADIIEGQITLTKPIQETEESAESAAVAHFNPQVSEISPRKPDRHRAAWFAVILLLIFLGIFGYLYYFSGNHPIVANLKPFLQQSLGWLKVPQQEASYPNPPVDQPSASGSGILMISDNKDRGQTPALEPNNNAVQQDEIARLQSRLSDLKSQKEAVEMQLRRLQSDYNAIHFELEELKGSQERIAELESVIAVKDNMLSKFEQRLNELEKDLDRYKNSKDMSLAELATKNALVAELQEKLEASLSNQRYFEEKINKSKKEIAQLHSRLSDLNAQRTTAENQLTQLKTRNDSLITEIDDLKASQKRLAELETGVEQRDQTLSQLEDKLKDLEKENEEKIATSNNLKMQLSSKTTQVEDLQQKLINYKANYVTLEDEFARSKEQMAQLQSQFSDLNAQRTSAENKLAQLKTRNDDLVTEIEELKASQKRLAELETGVEQRDQTLSQLEDKLKDLENANEKKIATSNNLKMQLSSKTAQVEDLQQKLINYKAYYVKLEDEMARSKEQMAQLQSQFSDLNAQRTSAENKLAQLKTRNDALVTEIEELKGSQKRLAALETGVEQRDQALSQLEGKLKDLENANEKKIATNNNLKMQLSSKTTQVEDLQQKLNNYQANYVKLEDDLARSIEEIAQLKGQLSDLKTKQASAPIAPAVLKKQEEPPAKDVSPKTEAETPNPAAIIDWVLKKKSQ